MHIPFQLFINLQLLLLHNSNHHTAFYFSGAQASKPTERSLCNGN